MSDNTPSNLFKNSLVLTTALAVIGTSTAAHAYNRRATLPSIEVHLEVLESLRQQAYVPQRNVPATQPQTAPQQQAAVPFGRPSKPLAAQPQQQPVVAQPKPARQVPVQQYVQQPAPQPVAQAVPQPTPQPVQQQPVVETPMPVPAPQPAFIEPKPQPQVAQPTMPTEPKMANGKAMSQFEPSGEPTIASTRRVPSQQPVFTPPAVKQPAPAQRPVVQNFATYEPAENAQDPIAPEYAPREVTVNGPLRRPVNNPVIPEVKPEVKAVVVEAPQEKPAEVKVAETPKPEKKEPLLTLTEEAAVEPSTEEVKVTEMNPALAPVKLPDLPKPTKTLTAEEEAALNAEDEDSLPWTGEETIVEVEPELQELPPVVEPKKTEATDAPKLVQIAEPEEKLELPALPGMEREVQAEAELTELPPANEPEAELAELPDDLLPLEALPDHEAQAEADAKAQRDAEIAEAKAEAAKAAALKAEAEAEAAEIAAEEAKEAELAAAKAAEEEKEAEAKRKAEAAAAEEAQLKAESEAEAEAEAEAELTLAAETPAPDTDVAPDVLDEPLMEVADEEAASDDVPPPPLVKKTKPKKEEGLFSGLTSKVASLLGKDEDKEVEPETDAKMPLPKLPKGALPMEDASLTEESDVALTEMDNADAEAEADAELTGVDELPGLPPLPSQKVDEVPVATAPNRALPSLSAIVSEDRREEINKIEAEREAAAAKAKAAEREAKLAKAEAKAAAEEEAVKLAQAAAEAKEQSEAKLKESPPAEDIEMPAEEMQVASLAEDEAGNLPETPKKELQAPEIGFDEYSRKQVRLFYGRDDKDVQAVMQPALDELVAQMKEESSSKLKIEAYAGSNLEDATVSSRMSLSRALALRAYFIEAGIDTDRVNVASMGNKSGRGPQERADITLD